jgi:hypothetical protein
VEARLPARDRGELAVQALARSEWVSDLAAKQGVSRKSVYQQTHKARIARNDTFGSATPDRARSACRAESRLGRDAMARSLFGGYLLRCMLWTTPAPR